MDLKKKTPIIAITIITMILMIGYHELKIVTTSDNYIKRCIEQTVGTVIDYKMTWHRSNRTTKYYHHITIKYNVDGKEYETKGVYRGYEIKPLETGDKIYILYNPNNPEEIVPEFTLEYVNRQNKLDKKMIIITIIIYSLIVIAIYNKEKYEIKF
jgi:hypothetical protein